MQIQHHLYSYIAQRLQYTFYFIFKSMKMDCFHKHTWFTVYHFQARSRRVWSLVMINGTCLPYMVMIIGTCQPYMGMINGLILSVNPDCNIGDNLMEITHVDVTCIKFTKASETLSIHCHDDNQMYIRTYTPTPLNPAQCSTASILILIKLSIVIIINYLKITGSNYSGLAHENQS